MAKKQELTGTLPKEKSTQSYILKEGATHYQDKKLRSAGESVDLTDKQAKSFADKLVPEGGRPKVVGPRKTAQRIPSVSDGVPSDIGSKTPDPNVVDPNPQNKVPMTPGKG
jgi:hypothetical protein